MIKVCKDLDGRRYVSARVLHRALGVSIRFDTWLEDRLLELNAIDGKNYYTVTIGRNRIVRLSPAFAQELALWERSPQSRTVAQAISHQLIVRSPAAAALSSHAEAAKITARSAQQRANKLRDELVAPIPTTELVIKGLNDPAILRAVLFHYIELNDNRETAKRG